MFNELHQMQMININKNMLRVGKGEISLYGVKHQFFFIYM